MGYLPRWLPAARSVACAMVSWSWTHPAILAEEVLGLLEDYKVTTAALI